MPNNSFDSVSPPPPRPQQPAAARPKSRFTLRQRLLLLTAVALLPAFVIIAASQISSRATRTREVNETVTRLTEVVRGEVVRGITGAGTMMVAMGRSSLADPGRSDDCNRYAASIQIDFPTIIDIAVAGPDGAVYCHAGPTDLATLQAGIDKLKSAATPGRLFLGLYTPTSAGPTLPMGMALADADKKIIGYIQFNVDLDVLVSLVTAATQGITSRTTVTDTDGTVMMSLPQGTLENGTKVPDRLASYIAAPAAGITRLPGDDGQTWTVGYQPATDPLPIAVFFERPDSELMAPLDRDAMISTAIAVAGAALAFLIAWFIGSVFIQRPVNALENVLAARRAGDQDARSGLTADGSEFGRIGTAVDDLFDELDRREALQRQAEEQRDLQAREVQHRVKNLMAVIQVIARQTLSRADASREVRTFERRIDAMIRANSTLLAPDPRAGDLGKLIEQAVTPFVDAEAGQVSFEGPPLRLRPKVAMAIALAAHELATNAAKYGALSDPRGKVVVHWQTEGGQLTLDWREHDGPPVSPPSETGFGTMLISRALEVETRGHVTITYEPDGFTFRLGAPLEVIADEVPVTGEAAQ